jgi:hypothetical protein
MKIKRIVPFLITFLTFVIVSLAYFSPVLEGKELFQSDIAQFRGMSKEVQEFRAENGTEPYWTNRAFGGMPTYQLSTYYPNDYIKKIDSILRFLPRPADYLFLYFLGFFVLLMVLKIDWKLAIIGSLAFGFSTYFIIILGVGHNAKAHAIAYMPMVLAGVLLVFQKKYLSGFILTAFAMALEINASHLQMTYYLMFMILIFGLVYLMDAIKNKELPVYLKNIGILIVAVILSIGVNATSLLATKEYADQSTRSKSELTISPTGEEIIPSGGLSKEYITQYSYGILETFDLFIPRFMGGSNSENIGKDSYTYNFLSTRIERKQALGFAEHAPMYWGDQPIVAAPAYLGAVILLLFVLGIFLVKGRVKNWLVAATIFSVLLSWGKNFDLLTNFFIDYVPLYNKFRAVSSIQVIAELAVPLLGIIALQKFMDDTVSWKRKLHALKYSLIILGGAALFFTVAGSNFFAFESFRDANYESMIPGFADVIISDRKSIFIQDSFRSLLFVLLTAAILWLFLRKKISKNAVFGTLLAFVIFDMVDVDKRYVNNDDFISKRKLENPFRMSAIDKEIKKDKGHYRVMNFMVDPMNDGSTSYFHNSIGGYHAAKPRRYQELYDFQISRNNIDVLNMLNTKYIIYPDNENRAMVQLNVEANSNAWFVSNLEVVDSANEEIKALDSLNTRTTAVIRSEFIEELTNNYLLDSSATISLVKYSPNVLTYKSSSSSEQIAVFSEIYYKHGWKAYIDGKETKIYRVNYVLRAIEVASGEHEIKFKFEPEVIKNGNKITLVSYAFLLLIPLVWFVKKKKSTKNK